MSPLYVSLYTIIHAFLDFVNTFIVSAVLVIYCWHISKAEFIGIVITGVLLTPLRICDIPCIYSDEFIKYMLQCITFRRKSDTIILFSPLPCERFPTEFVLSNVIAIVSAAIKRNYFWWYSVLLQTYDKFIFVHILIVSLAKQPGVIARYCEISTEPW